MLQWKEAVADNGQLGILSERGSWRTYLVSPSDVPFLQPAQVALCFFSLTYFTRHFLRRKSKAFHFHMTNIKVLIPKFSAIEFSLAPLNITLEKPSCRSLLKIKGFQRSRKWILPMDSVLKLSLFREYRQNISLEPVVFIGDCTWTWDRILPSFPSENEIAILRIAEVKQGEIISRMKFPKYK